MTIRPARRGHSIPVAEMRYWLVGAPAPALPHDETLGEDRRLAGLSAEPPAGRLLLRGDSA